MKKRGIAPLVIVIIVAVVVILICVGAFFVFSDGKKNPESSISTNNPSTEDEKTNEASKNPVDHLDSTLGWQDFYPTQDHGYKIKHPNNFCEIGGNSHQAIAPLNEDGDCESRNFGIIMPSLYLGTERDLIDSSEFLGTSLTRKVIGNISVIQTFHSYNGDYEFSGEKVPGQVNVTGTFIIVPRGYPLPMFIATSPQNQNSFYASLEKIDRPGEVFPNDIYEKIISTFVLYNASENY